MTEEQVIDEVARMLLSFEKCYTLGSPVMEIACNVALSILSESGVDVGDIQASQLGRRLRHDPTQWRTNLQKIVDDQKAIGRLVAVIDITYLTRGVALDKLAQRLHTMFESAKADGAVTGTLDAEIKFSEMTVFRMPPGEKLDIRSTVKMP